MKPTYKVLSKRIMDHLATAKDEQETREIAIAWGGYIGALVEWKVISIELMYDLSDLLPTLENDPSLTVLGGVDADDDDDDE